MKILLVTDGQSWIVDRISQEFKNRISEDIDIRTRRMSPEELLEISGNYDLIHYNNWGIFKYEKVIKQIKTPQIMSVRSFRYEAKALELAEYMRYTHVIHPELSDVFPRSYYVSDGVFVDPKDIKPFRVGMAFQDTPENKAYKGYNLVKEVCDHMGVELVIAHNLPPDQMTPWYRSIDLLICASIEEGFSAPAMECLALNIPVLTTKVGIPKFLNVHFITKEFQSIKEGIEKFYTSKQVYPLYSWENACIGIQTMYLLAVHYDNTK